MIPSHISEIYKQSKTIAKKEAVRKSTLHIYSIM